MDKTQIANNFTELNPTELQAITGGKHWWEYLGDLLIKGVGNAGGSLSGIKQG